MSARAPHRPLLRLLTACAAVVALVGLGQPPASAGVAFSVHQRGDSARAGWSVGDPRGTWLGITGWDTATRLSGQRTATTSFVSVDVEQHYCDATAGEQVDSFWNGRSPAAVRIDHARYLSAGWAPVTVVLSGAQYRTPLLGGDCAAPDWENGYEAASADLVLTVGATFTATSPLVLEHSTRLEAYPPYRFVTVQVSRGRWAQAHVVATTADPRLPDLTQLGADDTAAIGHTIHTELTVVKGRAA
jgi:hypothetical protein